MLQLARDLKQTVAIPELPVEAAPLDEAMVAVPSSVARPASTQLSDREREVAELLLLGMPYRDIGSQLFISAKTVEHHVARIRRRLGRRIPFGNAFDAARAAGFSSDELLTTPVSSGSARNVT